MVTRIRFVVKIECFSPQNMTRIRFVVKIECFSPQNGDENRPRRQKMKFPDQKR
ncbi:hypothetical protein V6C20_08995 [Caldibacillus thermoamylovorans]